MDYKKICDVRFDSEFTGSMQIVFLEKEADFKKLSEKAGEYLFEQDFFVADEDGKDVVAAKHYYAFDKDAKMFFGFEKLLLPEEKLDELAASEEDLEDSEGQE